MRMSLGLTLKEIAALSTSDGAASPKIRIASGSGYAGSVYASNMSGQWYADGVAIAGATGATFTMTVQYEGAELYQIIEQASTISVASGSGYAGPLYRSNASGQWYADGSAIPGVTSSSWTMSHRSTANRRSGSLAARLSGVGSLFLMPSRPGQRP